MEQGAFSMKVADEVWTSVALLHKENPERADFTVEEIKARAQRENWPIRPGFTVHASYHCLANKPANPANHRMLYEDSRGRKKLYRPGDPCHSERENGKIHPDKQDLLPAYQSLVDWYEASDSKLDTVRIGAKMPGTSRLGLLRNAITGDRSHWTWVRCSLGLLSLVPRGPS